MEKKLNEKPEMTFNTTRNKISLILLFNLGNSNFPPIFQEYFLLVYSKPLLCNKRWLPWHSPICWTNYFRIKKGMSTKNARIYPSENIYFNSFKYRRGKLGGDILLAHCSRCASKIDLRSQQKFRWDMDLWGKNYQKMKKKSTEGT